MRRIACFAIFLMFTCWTFFPIATGHTSPFLEVLKNDARIMVAFKDVGKAGDFIEYAENILKQAVKQHDGKIMNPEIMKKVKEDKLLWQAIQDGNGLIGASFRELPSESRQRLINIGQRLEEVGLGEEAFDGFF